METLYWVLFAALIAVCAFVEFGKGAKDKLQTSSAFLAFRNNYIVVYCLMMGETLDLTPSLLVHVLTSV